MCDQPSRENGGLCGECCPLPASATGLYKHLIWLGIFQALGGLSAAAFLLREEGDPTIQNDPMAIVGHIGNLCNFETNQCLRAPRRARPTSTKTSNEFRRLRLCCWC